MSVVHVPVAKRSPFEKVIDGMVVSRSIHEAKVGTLGGGIIRFEEDAVLEGTLEYDEAVYVLAGELTLSADGVSNHGVPGDLFLLSNGTTAVYDGKAGTELYYVLTPRPE